MLHNFQTTCTSRRIDVNLPRFCAPGRIPCCRKCGPHILFNRQMYLICSVFRIYKNCTVVITLIYFRCIFSYERTKSFSQLIGGKNHFKLSLIKVVWGLFLAPSAKDCTRSYIFSFIFTCPVVRFREKYS